MSIHCQKCGYHFTNAEALGYMAAECYALFKESILPNLIALYTRRGVTKTLKNTIEETIIGILNKSKLECHVCMHYYGWSAKSKKNSLILSLKTSSKRKELQ